MLTRIYKPGQGKYARLGTGFAIIIVVAFGCWQLYELLEATDMGLWVATIVPVVVLAAFAGLLFWLLNKPAAADFLIAAEGELKKVNWSSRREVAVSTLVVIIVVFVMAVLLGTTDFVFALIFDHLL